MLEGGEGLDTLEGKTFMPLYSFLSAARVTQQLACGGYEKTGHMILLSSFPMSQSAVVHRSVTEMSPLYTGM